MITPFEYHMIRCMTHDVEIRSNVPFRASYNFPLSWISHCIRVSREHNCCCWSLELMFCEFQGRNSSCSIRNIVPFVAQYVVPCWCWKRAVVFFYGECHWDICDTEHVNRRISARGKNLMSLTLLFFRLKEAQYTNAWSSYNGAPDAFSTPPSLFPGDNLDGLLP